MYKSQLLTEKYCPSFYQLLDNRKFSKWKKLDSQIEKQLLSEGIIKTNFIRLLLELEMTQNEFLKEFFKYIDNLINDILTLIPEKEKRIWNSINGKFDNLADWNYLNPIGEFSILRMFIESGKFTLNEIEKKFSNNSSKDFSFIIKITGKEVVIEVLNIHPPTDLKDHFEIKEFLIDKVQKKIAKELANIDDPKELENLYFLPVVWFLEIDFIKSEYQFFKEFNTTFGKGFGIKHPTIGFCTHFKENGKVKFLESSEIIKRKNNGG